MCSKFRRLTDKGKSKVDGEGMNADIPTFSTLNPCSSLSHPSVHPVLNYTLEMSDKVIKTSNA